MGWVWVLIPLVAILVGGFQEWLKFKEKQAKIGSSTRELGQTITSLRESIEQLEGERDSLTRRVQNLEAIVTTQEWDELHGRPASGFLGSELDQPDRTTRDGHDDAEAVSRIAKKLSP